MTPDLWIARIIDAPAEAGFVSRNRPTACAHQGRCGSR
jgi:hypothetical protein